MTNLYIIIISSLKIRPKRSVGLPGMTGPPNSFTAQGPVTLTAILFTQPAV